MMKCILKRRMSSERRGKRPHVEMEDGSGFSNHANMVPPNFRNSISDLQLPVPALHWSPSVESKISDCTWEGLISTPNNDSMGSMRQLNPALKNEGRVSDSSRLNNAKGQKSVTLEDPKGKQKSKVRRSRKRLSKLLHTHAALIFLSVLVVLDATCVIGQLLADIFIVKEHLERAEIEKQNVAQTLKTLFPRFFNASDHLSLDKDLIRLKETLEAETLFEHLNRYVESQAEAGGESGQRTTANLPVATKMVPQTVEPIAKTPSSGSTNTKSDKASPSQDVDVSKLRREDILLAWRQLIKLLKGDENILKIIKTNITFSSEPTEGQSGNSNQSKPKNGSHRKKPSNQKNGTEHNENETEDHDILLEVTHVFHLVSLSILSILLLETLLKIFAMGRKLWNHKLEVFDAGVIITSWSLDLAFKDGIWDHPGSNAATILIILLPWRVVRIVNSFVLVIQEKDNVRLKLIKQRYRSSERRTREYKEKLNKYRVETKSLQGVCRKFGVPEGQITACMPIEKRKRRRLAFKALSEFASLAMVSTGGNVPNLASKSEYSSDSSSSSDESSDQHREIDRTVSADSAFSQTNSIFSTVSFVVECQDDLGEDNIAYTHEALHETGSLPTYEDAMISVYNSNSELIHSQNHHTKL